MKIMCGCLGQERDRKRKSHGVNTIVGATPIQVAFLLQGTLQHMGNDSTATWTNDTGDRHAFRGKNSFLGNWKAMRARKVIVWDTPNVALLLRAGKIGWSEQTNELTVSRSLTVI